MSEHNIRRHGRIPCAGPVRLSWASSGNPCYALGKCLDISTAGLRVESPEPIPATTVVTLRAERLNLSTSAIVKHSERRGPRYVLGLELNEALLERTLALASQTGGGSRSPGA